MTVLIGNLKLAAFKAFIVANLSFEESSNNNVPLFTEIAQ